MRLLGRGWQSAWWGPLVRILAIVLTLLPLLSLPHGNHTEHPGTASPNGPVALETASGHDPRCPPTAGHGAEPFTLMPCCAGLHLGCCPLLVTEAKLSGPLLAALPPPSAAAAFASLRGPPPLPPPITSSA